MVAIAVDTTTSNNSSSLIVWLLNYMRDVINIRITLALFQVEKLFLIDTIVDQ